MHWQCMPWLLIPSIANACGVAVHLELVDRILPLLPDHISQHYNYIRSGAFYPDAFYNCQGEYDVAEDAHWPPFLANGVKLVHNRRAQGRDTAEIEAFLVGILTHQVSDVSWHSLGLFEGLLRAMADSEFDGDYDKAHSNLDVGGDMIWLSRHTNAAEKSTDWDYNVQDIVALLRINGYQHISESSIRFCMARGKAAYSAELRTADVAFKRFARRSPFIFDELESYTTGGLTDMHEQIQECLPTLLNWMNSSSTVDDSWNICPIFRGTAPDSAEEIVDDTHLLKRSPSASWRSRSRWHNHIHTAQHYLNDVLEIVDDSVPEIGKKLGLFLPENVKTLEREKIILAPQRSPDSSDELKIPSVQERRSLFGSALQFWKSDILVGAPGEGIVYILDEHGNCKNQINSSSSYLKRRGQWSTHFGAQIAIWNQHVVISSPGSSQLDIYNEDLEWVGGIRWLNSTRTYGSKGLKMVGEKLIVDEDDQTLYVGAPQADIHVDSANESSGWIDQAGAVYSLPVALLQKILHNPGYVRLETDEYMLYHGTHGYDKAGSSLAVTPRFILVGVPGKKQVLGFDFAKKTNILTLRDTFQSGHTGFGKYLLTGSRDILVVGAPSTHDNQEGVIHVYKNNQMRIVTVPNEFSWFGRQGVLVGASKLITASPHANDGRGLLWELDLQSAEAKLLGMPIQGFGSSYGAEMATNGTVVAIGMPHWGSQTKNHRRLGAVSLVRL